MFNKVILMGNLTRDPELRTAASGVTVCKFSIAVDRGFSRQGEEKQVDFFNVTCFRQTAEFVSRWFSKGRMILVEGKVQNDNYTDNNGVKHYSVNIIADNVSFCGNKSDNGGNGYQNGGGYGNNGGGYQNGGYSNGGGYQNNGGYGNGGYQGGYQNGGNNGGYGNNGYNNGGGYPNNGGNNGGYGNNGYNNNGGGYPDNGYSDNSFQTSQPPAPQQSAPPQQFQQNQPSEEKKTVELGNISDFEEIISDGDVPF